MGDRERNELRRAVSFTIKEVKNMMGRRCRLTVSVIEEKGKDAGVGDSKVKKELISRCCETVSVVEEEKKKKKRKEKLQTSIKYLYPPL